MFGWKEILKLFGFSLEFGLSFWDVGSAVGVGASLLGGAMGSDAAGKASGQQSAAMQQAIKAIQDIGDRTRSDTEIYRNLGSGASTKLATLLGINPYGSAPKTYSMSDLVNIDDQGNFTKNPLLSSLSPDYDRAFDQFVQFHQNKYGTSANLSKGSDEGSAENTINSYLGGLGNINKIAEDKYKAIESDPTYGSLLKKFSQSDLDNDLVYQNGLKFGLDNGNKAIMNQARALGGADSGSVLKALTRYGNDYASTKTEGAYNRFNTDKNNIYNMLTGQQTVGQNAVNTDANTGSQLAQALSGAYGAIGNANSAGTVGQANAWTSALGNIGKIAAGGGGIFDNPVFKW